MLVYDIYNEKQPLIVTRYAVRKAVEQYPELEQEILSVIKRGIIRVEED